MSPAVCELAGKDAGEQHLRDDEVPVAAEPRAGDRVVGLFFAEGNRQKWRIDAAVEGLVDRRQNDLAVVGRDLVSVWPLVRFRRDRRARLPYREARASSWRWH